MNKQQAYNAFWRKFGVLAFEENSVPDDAAIEAMIKAGVAQSKYPYITYQVLVDDLSSTLMPTASIWDNSSSFERGDLLANDIADEIKRMGTIKIDGGRMFIATGTPFAQHQAEETDRTKKRVVLTIGVQFFTN